MTSDARRPLDAIAPLEVDQSVDRNLTHVARAHANSHAILCGEMQLTYGALEARANQLSAYLRRRGVEPGDRIAIITNRSPEAVIAMIATLKCGATYVPLDPIYPVAQLNFALADCKPKLLLVQRDALVATVALDFAARSVVTIEDAMASAQAERDTEVNSRTQIDDCAYIMYTSGSTGRPKGVLVTHRGIIRLVTDQSYAAFGPNETFLQLAPLAFDASTFEIWGALLNGGKLAIVSDSRPSADDIAHAIRRHGVTTAWFTAALFHAIVDDRIDILKPLRQVLSGGDVLSPSHVRKAQAAATECEFINGYGPTENTTFTCCYRIPRSDWGGGAVPIGEPIARTSVLILNDKGEAASVGEVGELYAGGEGLALGYLNRPDLTTERFVRNPFRQGERLYSTGDYARWREDGAIDFMGRKDGQVKINGYRVELGEIEAVLCEHEGIGQAATIVRTSTSGAKYIHAFVTLDRAATISESAIRSGLADHISKRLPTHMSPRAITIISQMPRTENGKTDRTALSELVADDALSASAKEAPSTPTIAINQTANFSNSRAPTVEAAPQAFPASYWQIRHWRDSKLARGGVALNAAMRIRIDGATPEGAVERAFQDVIARHEALRTGFAERDGALVQLVSESVNFKLVCIDLQRLPEGERVAAAERIGIEEARTPFDLSAPPLLRAKFLRLKPDQAILLFTLHPMIADGWCFGMLVRELGLLIDNHAFGQRHVLDDIDLQYADFTLWQREMLSSGALDADRAYWRAKLDNLPRFEVEPDRPRTPEGSNNGEIRSLLLPKGLTDAVEAQARTLGVSFNSLCAASLATMLHVLTGEREVVFGTQIAARDSRDMEGVFGPLMNALALRFEPGASPSFAHFARAAHGAMQDALDHQRLPFDALTDDLKIAEDPARHPVFAINFNQSKSNVERGLTNAETQGRFKITALPSHAAGALYDLNFFMIGRAEGWRISCEFNSDLYDSATADKLLNMWERAFEGIAAKPDAPLKDVCPISQSEMRAPAGPRPAPLRLSGVPKSATRPQSPRLAALRDRIVPIQAKGDKTPIIAINNLSVYYPLARHLGEDRPFIDIQFCPSHARQALPYRDFRDIARDVVELIRLAQPHGPYILFGFCVCGALALEAAQQLKADGEEVKLVVLNDTWRPGYRENLPIIDKILRRLKGRKTKFDREWARLRAREITLSEFLAQYAILKRTGVLQALISMKLLPPLPSGRVEPIVTNWFADYLNVSQSKYEPAPYDGDVVMFRCTYLPNGKYFDRDFGWTPFVSGRKDVFDVPSEHVSLFRDPGAEVIAAHLNNVLREIEGD